MRKILIFSIAAFALIFAFVAYDVAQSAPIYSSGLSFDGTNYIDAGNGISLQVQNNFTIAYWFNSQNIADDQRAIIDKGFYAASAFTTGHLNTKMFFGGKNATSFVTLVGNTVLTSGWNFYTVSYDGTTIKIYQNGIPDGSISAVLVFIQSNNLTIGRNSFGGYYSGVVDDVRIYNRALSATEISNLYNGFYVNRSGLVAEYLINEEQGTNVYDSSNNDNKGTIYGATWINYLLPKNYSELYINSTGKIKKK